jgi:hypothetical protein
MPGFSPDDTLDEARRDRWASLDEATRAAVEARVEATTPLPSCIPARHRAGMRLMVCLDLMGHLTDGELLDLAVDVRVRCPSAEDGPAVETPAPSRPDLEARRRAMLDQLPGPAPIPVPADPPTRDHPSPEEVLCG